MSLELAPLSLDMDIKPMAVAAAPMLAKSDQRFQEMAQQLGSSLSHAIYDPLREAMQECIGDAGPNRQAIQEHLQLSMDRIVQLREFVWLSQNPDKMESVCLQTLFDQLLKELAPLIAESGATIESCALPRIKGSERQLSLMLRHLLRNAMQYTDQLQPHIVLRWEARGAFAQLQIIDDGLGMESELVPMAFALFTRLHETSNIAGMGCGLAVARQVARNHGGDIQAISHPDKGTAMMVTLRCQ